MILHDPEADNPRFEFAMASLPKNIASAAGKMVATSAPLRKHC